MLRQVDDAAAHHDGNNFGVNIQVSTPAFAYTVEH
jgi:hypothetical protein